MGILRRLFGGEEEEPPFHVPVRTFDDGLIWDASEEGARILVEMGEGEIVEEEQDDEPRGFLSWLFG